VGELRERLTKARAENDVIIIGLRSSIFASVGRVNHLVVINEWSEHHWERQTPYWNTRDVALTRQEIEGSELHFVGDAISTELGRLLDIGYLTMRKAPTRWIRPRKRTITFSPDTYHRSISEGLKSGPVLVSVAARNYVSSLLCARCRSKAICHCGGAMQEMSPSQYSCSLCLRKENSLKCSQCHGTKFLMLRKGAERIAEELGKAFPNIAIHKVNADSSPFIDSKKPSIVISTLGAEPRISPKYAAGVLLDGELLANGATLRSEEATWQRWWRIVGLLRTEAPIYISLPSEHTISQSIASGSHQIFLHRTLAARKDSSLPPYSRMIEISGDLSALRNLALKLKVEITLPLEIYPLSSDGNLWIKSSLESTPSILKTLRVVQRYRSASKRELLSIKVDSYQI
jgi:primosomal protein N' (replication factor Y)